MNAVLVSVLLLSAILAVAEGSNYWKRSASHSGSNSKDSDEKDHGHGSLSLESAYPQDLRSRPGACSGKFELWALGSNLEVSNTPDWLAVARILQS